MLIDSHCHIYDEALKGEFSNIVNNFNSDDLNFIINASSSKKTSEISLKMADEYEKIYVLLGVHPEEAIELDTTFLKWLKKNAQHRKVVAIGEVGLDYHYQPFDKQLQKDVFLKQAEVANKLKLPIVIHLRDAYGDFYEIVKQNKHLFANGMLFHCYSGSLEFAESMLALIDNTYFAFGGALTFKNAKSLMNTAKNIRIDRILSETDCPYLTPEPLRGKVVNVPKNVKYVVQKLADLKEISYEKMQSIIERNTLNLFTKIKIK